ncbi:hypothetical protein B0H14DRAFT_3480813 [Mycena olivaceomarginata]|nr:hypothetical protein B0H14DRAFT_3480813 [Mycena olivaceomarginata]
MHSALFDASIRHRLKLCAAGGKTSAKASVHKEDVPRFCVAVASNKGAHFGHACPAPGQAFPVAAPSLYKMQTQSQTPTATPSRPRNPRAPVPAPTPQNPLRHLQSRLLPRGSLPRPSALTIPVPYPRLPGSAGASVAWHSAESSCHLHAAVASVARHGTGLPTTTDAWRDSDATLLPAGATSMQPDSLAHACGKTLSTSTLVDAPATPPALGTRVRGGEREKDAVEQRAQPAAIPVLWHGSACRRVPATSVAIRGGAQRDANGGPYMQSNFGTPFPESL